MAIARPLDEPTRSVARAAWPRPSRPGMAVPHQRRDAAVVRRIRHRWTDLFDLVLDLERYPDFVPHCRAVQVHSRAYRNPAGLPPGATISSYNVTGGGRIRSI